MRTVQSELLKAFALAGLPRNPVVAGRTDKGVSARMQVISARLERERDPASLVPLLNAHLPDDLGVHLARRAAPTFHAAWSADSKEYRYQLASHQLGDQSRMKEAMAMLVGCHNFKVFHYKSSAEKPRTITSVELLEEQTLRFVGEGFGRYMVRMLVGALVGVALGDISLSTFHDGLIKQHNFYCPTAEPEPLTLWSVGYPPELDPFSPEDRETEPEWRNSQL